MRFVSSATLTSTCPGRSAAEWQSFCRRPGQASTDWQHRGIRSLPCPRGRCDQFVDDHLVEGSACASRLSCELPSWLHDSESACIRKVPQGEGEPGVQRSGSAGTAQAARWLHTGRERRRRPRPSEVRPRRRRHLPPRKAERAESPRRLGVLAGSNCWVGGEYPRTAGGPDTPEKSTSVSSPSE